MLHLLPRPFYCTFWILICFCCTTTLCQAQIFGKVTDSKGRSLPTVNVYILNTYVGTTSNDEGLYELQISEPGTYTVVFQYLGYETKKNEIKIATFPYELNIDLQEETIELSEVAITAGFNPANEMIRKTIENRKKILEKTKNYTADFYSRGLIRIKDAPEKILGQAVGDLGGGLDSTRSGIIYLSETISKISHSENNEMVEKIVASKVSGDDNGFSFNNASDVNYNYYQNTVAVGDVQIVSPIADYAFSYYRYHFEGRFYDEENNAILKINFEPKNATDRVFSGTIYIVDEVWEMYATEFTITGKQAQLPPVEQLLIKQSFYHSQTDDLWVRRSQSIDFEYRIFGIKGNGRFTAVYSNFNFQPNFETRRLTNEIISFEKEANKKDSLFWAKIRPVPLTVEENEDYTFKDSIQVIRKSKPYQDSLDAVNNRFKISNLFFGYTFNNSFEERSLSFSAPAFGVQYNTVQGWRPKMSVTYRQQNDSLGKNWSVGLETEYGIADQRVRTVGNFTYLFNRINRPFLRLSGGTEAAQFNRNNPISPFINSVSTLFFEDNFIKLYDRTFGEVYFTNEIMNGLRFYATVGYERRRPLFNQADFVIFGDDDDAFTSNNPILPNNFVTPAFEAHNLMKINIAARISFAQKYISYPDRKFNMPNEKYPVLWLQYFQGLAGSGTDYHYQRVEGRLLQELKLGNKGVFAYQLVGGQFFSADRIGFADYKHFNGNQTHIGTSENYTDVFNFLPYYELSTNAEYAYLHLEHNFKGYLLNKIPLLQNLNYNIVVGAHVLATAANKPYSEYTIGLDNLGFGKFRFLRIDYIRNYQNGFLTDGFVFGLKFLNIFQ
ncbi:MAG: DUF5686 and carboxypeptidase regulatory-like domain-containing protein [Bacteroidetes bacterium]|nr:DUF5686 and carboxypeptidase regulatory-like domain-containing protein [Bacteroidota bacterium]